MLLKQVETSSGAQSLLGEKCGKPQQFKAKQWFWHNRGIWHGSREGLCPAACTFGHPVL